MHLIIWLILWFGAMGLPNYLFKKYNITYYENSWQHTLFFIVLSLILFVVYQNQFFIYFNCLNIGHLIAFISLFILWLFVSNLYKKDYYSKKERFCYQLPKFFEIFFQDIFFWVAYLPFGFL